MAFALAVAGLLLFTGLLIFAITYHWDDEEIDGAGFEPAGANPVDPRRGPRPCLTPRSQRPAGTPLQSPKERLP